MRLPIRFALPFLFAACASQEPAPAPATTAANLESERCGDVASWLRGEASPTRETRAARARAYLDRCGLDETIALTKSLVAFPTVSESENAADGASFAAMRSFLEGFAQDAGLSFESFGKNDAWVIGYGAGAPSVGFIMHGDVVPVGDDKVAWSAPPFEAVVKDDRLYGRGSEDDKGPIASVLVVLRTLARFGWAPQGRLQAIIGLGEEHEWAGMKAYAQNSVHPRFPISVDADFPVVVAESGFVIWKLSTPITPASAPATKKSKKAKAAPVNCLDVKELRGGSFLTQVPGEAVLELARASDMDKVQAAVAAEASARGAGWVVTAEPADTTGVRIQVKGDAVHSSVADGGKNALWALAGVAARLPLCPSGARDMLALIHDRFDGDHYGQKLGLAYEHPLMGKLLVAPTVLRREEGQVSLLVNMRRPDGVSNADFMKRLDAAAAMLAKAAPGLSETKEERYVGDPALADTRGPLVATLLAIYQQAAADPKAAAQSIRGGTYARLFPGAVSFGPSLPGHPYRGHAPDEYVELPALSLMLHTQLEAILQLDGLPPAAVTSK